MKEAGEVGANGINAGLPATISSAGDGGKEFPAICFHRRGRAIPKIHSRLAGALFIFSRFASTGHPNSPPSHSQQSDPSMSGGSSSAKPAARGRKRVEATTVLKRSRDGSAFTRCEACNKDVPIVLIDMHSCSLDSKIRMTLEAQVVEKTVEITKAEGKRPAASAAKGNKAAKRSKEDAPKRKRPPTAFFLFMEDFRKEYKAAHPDNKSVSTVAKEGGEKWRSMTEEEKKPYIDKAAELKAHVDNGEGSGENNVAVEKGETADDEEQEVDQSTEDEDEAGDQEEKNELDDDI